MKRTFAAVLIFAGLSAFAQTQSSFRFPCAGVSAPVNEHQDWNPTLIIAEEDDEFAYENTDAIKDSLTNLYKNNHTSSAQTQRNSNPAVATVPAAPILNRNFSANAFNNSTPNDNNIAVANNGHLISVQNSNVFRRNTNTATNLGTQSLAAWASALGNPNGKYDPKVLYDPEANRFILVCLAGFSSSATNILIGFSRSDTANGLYNLYSIPGNPFNDTLWTDYPAIAVNHNELFCSVNLLHDNMSWQLGFVQTVIWQFNKWDGYNGDTLRTQLHSNINYNNRPIRNICPVPGGSGTFAGPDMYFLSERNLAAANDTVFLVHISDTANAVGQQTTVTALTTTNSYFMPPNAREPGNVGNMSTNDSRILGAFIQNNIIQYVSNTMDTSTGKCAIFHGTILSPNVSPSLTTKIIGDTALEFGYPNIAYAGYGTSTDNTSIINFLYSDSTTFPGFADIVCDGNGNYSAKTIVKAGLGYIDVLTGDERWGDYSGIQRKYDAQGTVWVNGMYGTANHTHATWVGELGVSSDVQVENISGNNSDISIFPNPFAESIHVLFTNEKTQDVKFVLYDINGREVTVLLQDQLPEGQVQFAFSPGPLASGVYLLRAEAADGSVLFTNRIVKQ
jgi:hypothetical protein